MTQNEVSATSARLRRQKENTKGIVSTTDLNHDEAKITQYEEFYTPP